MNQTSSYLYGFSIYGIQSYIFSTNKLREIVGASEIVEYVCKDHFDNHFIKFKGKLKIISQAAGNVKAVITLNNEELSTLKELYASLPESLAQYPDLTYVQGILKLDEEVSSEHLKELDVRLKEKRNLDPYFTTPSFMGIARAQRTGGIAVFSKNVDDGDIACKSKRKAANKKTTLLKEKLTAIKAQFPDELAEIASTSNDIALIHADANNLGRIFKKLPVEDIHALSQNVEEVTIKSFEVAVETCFGKGTMEDEKSTIKIRPVVLGGDDITVIIDATKALTFAHSFLEAFEKNLEKSNFLREENISACAGIVFTKQKFPLHYTADLAEDLCTHAKKESERKESAISMHRVRNTFARDYNRIRKHEQGFVKDTENISFFNLTSLKKLQVDLLTLRDQDFPVNNLREFLTLKMNTDPRSEFLWERILKKTPTTGENKKILERIISKDSKPRLGYLYHLINLKKFI